LMPTLSGHDAYRFQPHHVEARVCSAEAADEVRARDLLPGEARRLPE